MGKARRREGAQGTQFSRLLHRQALIADVCKIDVRESHRKAPLPDSVFNEVAGFQALQASSLQLYCKRDPGLDVLL